MNNDYSLTTNLTGKQVNWLTKLKGGNLKCIVLEKARKVLP